jgi:hypothetical protein
VMAVLAVRAVPAVKAVTAVEGAGTFVVCAAAVMHVACATEVGFEP